MTQRFDFSRVCPEGYQAMLRLHGSPREHGLSEDLIELLKVRVSQLNGCAFCLAMHIAKARAHGVGEDRMHLLAVWRESALYTPSERAALAWAEALTLLPGHEVPEAVYQEAIQHFTAEQLADLAMEIVQINGWNRLMIAARTPPADGKA